MKDESLSDDHHRSLADPAARDRRAASLSEPHVAPLSAYVADLRSSGRGFVPEFDPLDGGVGVRLLFLFEKPGPKTFPPGGSGFISRNNDDFTAETTHTFMRLAGIPRSATVTWNVIPWWNGTVDLTDREKAEGAAELPRLLDLLTDLRGVVFVGNAAFEHGGPHVAGRTIKTFRSAHPSVKNRNTRRDIWDRIPQDWQQAWQEIRQNP